MVDPVKLVEIVPMISESFGVSRKQLEKAKRVKSQVFWSIEERGFKNVIKAKKRKQLILEDD